MKNLRPELVDGKSDAEVLPNDTALFLIRDSVARRRRLLYGRLHGDGMHCALGAFWQDNPHAVINDSLVQEVAAVNDSIPKTATPHARWRKVNEWLRFKVASLARRA